MQRTQTEKRIYVIFGFMTFMPVSTRKSIIISPPAGLAIHKSYRRTCSNDYFQYSSILRGTKFLSSDHGPMMPGKIPLAASNGIPPRLVKPKSSLYL